MKTFVESTAPDHHGWCDAIECDVCHKRVEREGVTPQEAIDNPVQGRGFPKGALDNWSSFDRRATGASAIEAGEDSVDLCPTCTEIALDAFEDLGVNARFPRKSEIIYVTPTPVPATFTTSSFYYPEDALRIAQLHRAFGVVPASLPQLMAGQVVEAALQSIPQDDSLTDDDIQAEIDAVRKR